MVGVEFLVVFLLICLNGLLAGSELAMVSARPSRLQRRADEGSVGAQVALELHAEPDRFLSTVQIGITLIGVGTGALGGATLSDPVGDLLALIPGVSASTGDSAAVVVVVIGVTYLSLVIGELVPKRVAMQQAENVSVVMSRPLRVMSTFTAPIVTVLAKSSNVVLRVIRAQQTDEPSISAEEIHHLLREGTRHGVFEEAEESMVQGVFGIADRSAGELMTPRHRIIFIDLEDSTEEHRRAMASSSHSHYPVCEGSTDHVVGMVSTRQLWDQALHGHELDVREAMSDAHFVPEVAPVLTVMEQMRVAGSSDAMVVDEHGAVVGMITLDDMLSDVVGELDDDSNTGIKGSTRRDDGSWLLDGSFPAHETRELLGIADLPGEREGHFESVGGFVMEQLGHIPRTGETVTVDGYRIEVVDMDGHRIDKIMVYEVQIESDGADSIKDTN